jgi:hypothetical protein
MGLIAMSKGNYPMAKLVNPKIFNAVKHGVSSRHGLLPGENREDYRIQICEPFSERFVASRC